MAEIGFPSPLAGPEADAGCVYLLDADCRPGGGRRRRCDAPRRHGSPYCPRHHALCHLTRGSPAESARLIEIERLADAVGGRRSREEAGPSARFLDRLEALARGFL